MVDDIKKLKKSMISFYLKIKNENVSILYN